MSARKLRVCQITPDLHSGGIESRTARLLAAMSRDDYALSWIGFDRENPELVRSAGPGVEVLLLHKSKRPGGFDFGLFRTLVAHLRRLAPDVVHVHNWSTSLYGILGAKAAGVGRVIYSTGGYESPDPTASLRRRLAMRSLVPFVDRFVTVVEFIQRRVAHDFGLPLARIEVIPTGIELARFEGLGARRAEVRARLGIPTDAVVFGTLAEDRPVKRMDDLVEAAARVLPSRPRAHFLLAGDHRHAPRRATFAGRGLTLHAVGPSVPEDILAALDVFVNCSTFEGASNAIIEAMAAGLPVVATRVGGNPEVVDDGATGLLVPPMDPGALAGAIGRLVDDDGLRSRLGQAGRARAERRHDLRDMLGRYLGMYRELTRDPRVDRARSG